MNVSEFSETCHWVLGQNEIQHCSAVISYYFILYFLFNLT